MKLLFRLALIVIILAGIHWLNSSLSFFKETSAQTLSQQAFQSTEDLTQVLSDLDAKDAQIDQNVKSVAENRHRIMQQLLETDIKEFLKNVLSDTILTKIPDVLKKDKSIERKTKIKGKIETHIIDDFEKNTSTIVHYLKQDQSPDTASRIYFAQEPSLISGAGIMADAYEFGGNFVVDNVQDSQLQVTYVPSLNVIGEQPTAVILYNFPDNTIEPITQAKMEEHVFTGERSVNSYFKETSYDQVYFTGDIYGYFTVPFSRTACERDKWIQWLDQQVETTGKSISSYKRMIYISPDSMCGWPPQSTVGGNPSRIWMTAESNYPFSVNILIHEMGHSVGLFHASALDCYDKSVGSGTNYLDGCQPILDDGDVTDVLGWSPGGYHFNIAYKSALGWLASEQVLTVTENGIYSITPSEIPGGIKAIRIPLPNGLINDYYYLSYRQPFGYDALLPAGTTRGAQIHIWNDLILNNYLQRKSILIDAKPNSNPDQSDDFGDGAMWDGAVFIDEMNGITIKQLFHNSQSVELEITLNPDICRTQKPNISIFPVRQGSQNKSGLNYTVSLKNKDNLLCPLSNFHFTGLFRNFNYLFEPEILSLSPQEMATVSAIITLLNTTPKNAINPFTILVKDSNIYHTNHESSASAGYIWVDIPQILLMYNKPDSYNSYFHDLKVNSMDIGLIIQSLPQ